MRRVARILPLCAAIAFAAEAVVGWRQVGPADDVYAICDDCGLERNEIDERTETMRNAGKERTRAELVEEYYATDDERREAEPCRPCVEAVLDAAGVME